MKFITFLNNGCVDICENMLTSAKQVGIDLDNFYIACLDQKSYECMKKYKNSYIAIDQHVTDYQEWTFDENSSFRKIVKNKWKIILDVYLKHPNLCYVDTDIVFKSNPIPIIENNSNVLVQCDLPGNLICSGFMVFNNTESCKNLVNECGLNDVEDDQILINRIAHKYSMNISILNMEQFPNGYVYYQKNIKDKAVIVHNNHMVGIETKINKFKEENLWFI